MSDSQMNEQPTTVQSEQSQQAVQVVQGPGAQLAAQRQARGFTVEQVANQLNLAPRQIQALEADNYAALPGIVIARGFVRAYAKLLKVDPEPLVSLMQADVAPMESIQLKRALSGSFSESRLPPTVRNGLFSKWVIAATLLVLIVVGIFAAHWLGFVPGAADTVSENAEKGTSAPAGGTVSDHLSTVPDSAASASASGPAEMSASNRVTKDEIAAPATAAAANSPSASVTASAPVPATVPITASPAVNASQAAAAPKAATAPAPATATPAPMAATAPVPVTPKATLPATSPATAAGTAAPTAKTAPIVSPASPTPNAVVPQKPEAHTATPAAQDNANVANKNLLVMKLREDSWIEIKGADNSILISRLMKAGTTEMLAVNKPVSLTVGNVAGVDMTLRGNAVDLKSTAKNNVARLNLK